MFPHSTGGVTPPGWVELTPLVVLVLAVALPVYCLGDIARHPNTQGFPAQTWRQICLFGSVVGSLAYLMMGRSLDR